MSPSSSCSPPMACRPVVLLLLLLLFLSSAASSSCTELDGASSGGRHRHRQARRLLVSRPSTHKAEQWMWVGGEKRPFRNDAGASLGRRKIPRQSWNPVHN